MLHCLSSLCCTHRWPPVGRPICMCVCVCVCVCMCVWCVCVCVLPCSPVIMIYKPILTGNTVTLYGSITNCWKLKSYWRFWSIGGSSWYVPHVLFHLIWWRVISIPGAVHCFTLHLFACFWDCMYYGYVITCAMSVQKVCKYGNPHRWNVLQCKRIQQMNNSIMIYLQFWCIQRCTIHEH